jgi:TetR/AcrR family transcriptional regulator, transcriptional repressor for nem operon
MAWKDSHKQESRQRILIAAAELFTRKGFNQVGIDDVMLNAGLTRGAFYAHFSSKVELYEEAIVHASKTAAIHFQAQANSHEDLFDKYLSREHLESENIRCMLPCLVSDVAHNDERVRKTYTKLLKGFSKHLQSLSTAAQTEDAILLQTVLMVGGMALARSVTDEALAKKILSVCSNTAKASIQ